MGALQPIFQPESWYDAWYLSVASVKTVDKNGTATHAGVKISHSPS